MHNHFIEICSGSEASSHSRLVEGLRVIKKVWGKHRRIHGLDIVLEDHVRLHVRPCSQERAFTRVSRLPFKGVTTSLQGGCDALRDKYMALTKSSRMTSGPICDPAVRDVRSHGGRGSPSRGSRLPYKGVATPF